MSRCAQLVPLLTRLKPSMGNPVFLTVGCEEEFNPKIISLKIVGQI